VRYMKRWITLCFVLALVSFSAVAQAEMISKAGISVTFRGASRWGLSLDSGPVFVYASNAVVDPFNERRVVAQGSVGVETSKGNWELFPATVSWDIDSQGFATEVSASGPVVTLFSCCDSISAPVGAPRRKDITLSAVVLR